MSSEIGLPWMTDNTLTVLVSRATCLKAVFPMQPVSQTLDTLRLSDPRPGPSCNPVACVTLESVRHHNVHARMEWTDTALEQGGR